MTHGFDRLARAYRWMELLSFGPALMRCRLAMLPRMLDRRSALVLGDGDGRFSAALLRANRNLQLTAVDSSRAMLAQAAQRAHAAGAAHRFHPVHADATASLPTGSYDLVVTHFFLDCLTTAQVAQLAARLRPGLLPGAVWVVSEFAVPPRGPMRIVSAVVVRALYLAFRLLTGLRVQQLPDHAAALARQGFLCAERLSLLCGLLSAELWQLPAAASRAETALPGASNAGRGDPWQPHPTPISSLPIPGR